MLGRLLVIALCGCHSTAPVDEDHVHYEQHGVELRTLALAPHLAGVPMSGLADIAIDVTIPRNDYRKATGSIDLRCLDRCMFGDDVAKAHVLAELAPDGVTFGHLSLGGRIHLELRDGRAAITEWSIESEDLTLHASGYVQFAEHLEDSTIDACIAFAPKAALLARAQHTYELLSTTGAELQPDGLFHVRVTGALAHTQRRSAGCP